LLTPVCVLKVRCITEESQNKASIRTIRECYKGIATVLHECYKSVTKV
jgi:hypothetical protein